MKYELLEVTAREYITDDETLKRYELIGSFDNVTLSKIVTKRIGVVDVERCRLIYDSIDCPDIAIDHKLALSKAVDLMLGYHYKQSREMVEQYTEMLANIEKVVENGLSYSLCDNFNKSETKKMNMFLLKSKENVKSALEHYKAVHNYIALYVYTTAFKTLCKQDADKFADAINGTVVKDGKNLKCVDSMGIEFTIIAK